MTDKIKPSQGMIQIFRQREPALLLSGQTISALGNGVANIALTLLVLKVTNTSTTGITIYGAARIVPMLALLLFGGAFVDRVSRRLVMLVSDGARAVIVGVLAVLTATNSLQFWHLLIFSALFGLFDSVFMPAYTALTPEIVREDLLVAMNAVRPLLSGTFSNIIGVSLGAALVSWSFTAALVVDAATFFISATALALMKKTPKPVRHEEKPILHEIGEGLAFSRRTPWLWSTLVLAAFGNALVYSPIFPLMLVYLKKDLHQSRTIVALAILLSGVMSVLATIFGGSRVLPKRRIRVMWTAWMISLGGALMLALATHVWEVFLIPVLMSPTLTYGTIVWETMMQTEVPRNLLGRVSSVDWFVSLGLAPIGLIAAGALSRWVGIRTYFGVAFAVLLLPTIFVIFSRKVNAIDLNRVEPQSPEPIAVPLADES